MTEFHNYNTPVAGATDWHRPLNENFEQLDSDIEIRDIADNRSTYAPQDGTKFLATDTGQVYIGDGESWQPLSTTGPEPEYDAVNRVRWADSPDDINTQLQNLPDHGGIVRLRPDDYDDDDWTEPIEIPEKDGELSALTLDMRGSRIALSEFSPDQPYISREITQPNKLGLQLYGPDFWHVNQLSEPPSAVRLYDIELSHVWLPKLVGPFEYAVEKRAKYASGHFNQIYAHGWNVRSGFKIGDRNDDQTSDRSVYYGQFEQVTNYGAKIEQAKWNTIYAQVENTDGNGPGYGYHLTAESDIGTGANRLKIQERGADIPFYIFSPRTQIDLIGGIAADAWARSRHVVPPDQITDVGLSSEMFEWSVDLRGQFDIGGSDGTTSIVPYRALRLTARTDDGTDTHIQTVANATGSGGQYGRIWGVFHPVSQTDSAHRFSIWDDSDNYVGARADMTGDQNWHLVVTVDGNEVVDRDTGVAAETIGTILSVANDGAEQYLAIRKPGSLETGIADAQVDTTGFHRTNMRAEVTDTAGTPSDGADLDIRRFGYERG